MYSEDELIPISALQHYSFCPRQCALMYADQVWRDNVLTVQGTLLHERAHESRSESRADKVVTRGMRLRSLVYGLVGQADVVEFSTSSDERAISLLGRSGRWIPLVVEYKRGKPKIDRCDEIQVCAQVLCVEEMLGCSINDAALFYGDLRRRHPVLVDTALRSETIEVISEVRRILVSDKLPIAVNDKRCKRCSLREDCQPELSSGHKSASRYIQRVVEHEQAE